jgi:hypothetical protein
MIDFNPTDEWIAKNPCGFEPFEIPDFHEKPGWMGRVIAQLKDGMGKRSEASAKEAQMVEDWRGWAEAAASPDDLNRLKLSLVESEKHMPRGAWLQAKALLLEVGAARGWRYNVEARRFEGAEGSGESGIASHVGGPAGAAGGEDNPAAAVPPASPAPALASEPEPDPGAGPGRRPGVRAGASGVPSGPGPSQGTNPPGNAPTGPGTGASGSQDPTREGPGPGPIVPAVRASHEYRKAEFVVWTAPGGRRRVAEIVDLEAVDGRQTRALIQPVKESNGAVPEEELVEVASLEPHVPGEVNGAAKARASKPTAGRQGAIL